MKSEATFIDTKQQFSDDHWFQRNLDRFNQLVGRLEDGDVEPFIGAGLSVAGGFPSWEDHLRIQSRTARKRQGCFDHPVMILILQEAHKKGRAK